MSSNQATDRPTKGDWLEVRGLPGAPTRRGQILAVLGRPGHVRYRVRWDEVHESIFYPSEGAFVVRHDGRRRGG